ncbi:MAG: hypothetical protein MI924_08870 [Chloroflexales bacterium]|nr:hypothetical protein [Chloroflexales bacterium]
MTHVQTFPQTYPLVQEHIGEIYIPDSALKELGNTDVFVHLKDGRELGFTVFALPNIQQLMNQNALEAFVAPGMLVVTRVTWDAIFCALEECLRLSVGGGYSLEHFGILQTGADAEEPIA